MLYPTLIRLRPPSGFSRLFPWWVSQLWSENCASTLVTPVSFSSWPWLMYCSHYMLVQPGCSLCSALKLCHCLSFSSGFCPGVSCERLDDLRVFLLVCGLRRVKDPLYLLQVFSGKPLTFFFGGGDKWSRNLKFRSKCVSNEATFSTHFRGNFINYLFSSQCLKSFF